MKVYIYYGGLSGYRTILPDDKEDYMPIIDLALLEDERHRNVKVSFRMHWGIWKVLHRRGSIKLHPYIYRKERISPYRQGTLCYDWVEIHIQRASLFWCS